MSEERGWLIEVAQWARHSASPQYWGGVGGRWSDNHSDAVRFARKEDADRVRKTLREPHDWEAAKTISAEHSWHGIEDENS